MSSADDTSASFSSMGLSEVFARECLKLSLTLTSLDAVKIDGDWSRVCCCWWSPVEEGREITLNINFDADFPSLKFIWVKFNYLKVKSASLRMFVIFLNLKKLKSFKNLSFN